MTGPLHDDEDRDYDEDDYALCGSCEMPVEKDRAFYDEAEAEYFHPECAEVWRCSDCGAWNENSKDVCECGVPRS